MFSGATELEHWLSMRYVVGNKAKGQISTRVFQQNKAHQIFWKMNISYPLIHTRTCAYQGVKNVCFSENLACFVFLKHRFWDSSFCFITDEVILSKTDSFANFMDRKQDFLMTSRLPISRSYDVLFNVGRWSNGKNSPYVSCS